MVVSINDSFKETVLQEVQKIARKNMLALRSGPHAKHFRKFTITDHAALDLLVREAASHFWQTCKDKLNSTNTSTDETAMTRTLWASYVFPELRDKLGKGFQNLEELVQTYSEVWAIWFVGAGISFDAQTGWRTVRESLRPCFVPGMSHEDFDKEWARDEKGGSLWSALKRDAAKEKKFKEIFAGHVSSVISNGQGLDSHRGIAKLWNKALIEHLVCFNWDNYIEYSIGKQIEICFGNDPVGQNTDVCFWKPCGCVSKLDKPWIYPDQQDIHIHPELSTRVGNHPKPLIGIVIGYGGTLNFSKRQIEQCIGSGVLTYDIRPGLWPHNQLSERTVACGSLYAISFLTKRLRITRSG